MKLAGNFSAFVKALAGNTARLNDVGALGSSNLTLVLGNESADLDSMVSSLTLAYALSAQKSSSNNVVPIMNANRSDMTLRQDCQVLLQTTLVVEGGKGIEDLTFIDDIDLRTVINKYTVADSEDSKSSLDVWLVDHNAPSSRQSFLDPYVRGIVDHHLDEGKCQGAAWREIETIGSCTTLVAAKIRALDSPPDPALARLLLAPILLDTANFNPASQRATAKDKECYNWLVPLVKWAPHSTESVSAESNNGSDMEISGEGQLLQVSSAQELYKTLDKLKGSVKHLSSADLLRKDYKQWQVTDGVGKVWTVGISSITYRIQKWLKRDGVAEIESALQKWIASQGLDVALVMTHGKARPQKGQPKVYGRDLTVAFSQPTVSGLQESLLIDLLSASEALELQPLRIGDLQSDIDRSRLCFFVQTRLASSRKQVFPAVKHAIESM
ncbi:Exopolyphosphatase [Coemansia sp. RSA 1646]|nr:Exopolyphosphatase [Coemansia sp. RSA 1646]